MLLMVQAYNVVRLLPILAKSLISIFPYIYAIESKVHLKKNKILRDMLVKRLQFCFLFIIFAC